MRLGILDAEGQEMLALVQEQDRAVDRGLASPEVLRRTRRSGIASLETIEGVLKHADGQTRRMEARPGKDAFHGAAIAELNAGCARLSGTAPDLLRTLSPAL